MSQIFDALLRSQTESAGRGQVTETEATGLLQSVEQELASKWASADLFDEGDAASGIAPRVLFEPRATSSGIDGFSASGSAQSEPRDQLSGLFSQFRTLSVSLPRETRLVSLTDKKNPTAEAFRLLGVRLRDLRRKRRLQKVLISSTVPREGKSNVAANLACTLAHNTEEKTLLIDGDVRRPSQSQNFNLGNVPGLCEWLQGNRSLAESIYRLEGTGLWMLPAGRAPNSPLELLQSANLPLLMDQLSSWFDWIILDSPPILPLADTSVWARMVDGILLVTRKGITEKQQLERGLKAVDSSKFLGAIQNCSQASSYSSYYYSSSSES
ncbi:MAG TPA: CpsD/CapB family tyrosine-protein kinase [Terracidiphilus sp.]|jgi:capsular exopolysaccharide synthesis family protein